MSIDLLNVSAYDYLITIPDKSIDCIITDPVYDAKLALDELIRVCRGNIVVFSSAEQPFFIPDERAYWIKTPSTKNYSKHLGRFVELILIKRQGATFNAKLHWSNYTGVYNDLIEGTPIHPWQKPLTLIERLVRIYSNPGDLVCDPFSGSGTTAVACKNLNRNFVGCEIDNTYYELAKTRTEVAYDH